MMMRKTTLLLGMLLMMSTAQAQDFETATEAVKNMAVGWNLGNTLDSNSGDANNMWIEKWTSRTPNDYEKAWGQPVTKPELLKMMKEAGFNAIRVPVTWYPHMEAKLELDGTVWDKENDDIGTQIQTAWMERVHEVVDYVISQGMYCILNVHHDTGASNTAWLVASEDIYAKQKDRFEAVWKQIAEEFKDYDEHLLFEGYNEMLDPYQSWCFASFGTSSQYNASVATSAYNAINSYAQSFVNAVRATGGNNAQRNLIVNTYGSCCGAGTWNTHLQDPLKNMALPSDQTAHHLIFEVHSYVDIQNINNAKNEVKQIISDVKQYLAAKGAPVIFGEWGTSTDKGYDNYRTNMLTFARYFVEQTKANGMGTLYWMGLSDGEHRSVPEFNQADLKDAIIKGYYGEEGYSGIRELDNWTISPFYNSSDNGQIVNGQIVQCYDLQGRQVMNPRKGIYIKNRKKYLSAKTNS